MATAAAVSPSWVSDTWIVTSAKYSAMAPVSLTRGLPHISVTTSISRWMSSGNTGRCANRDPDQALITASFAAQRAARCRAADELFVRGVPALTRGEGLGEHRSGLVDLLGEIGNGDQVDPHTDDAHGRPR